MGKTIPKFYDIIKRIRFLLIICIVLSSCGNSAVSAQEKEEADFVSFKLLKLEKPNDWIEMPTKEVVNNLKKISFDPDKLEDIINDHNLSETFLVYSKQDPRMHAGIIPTIQVNIRAHETTEFDDFKEFVLIGVGQMKEQFIDFSVTDELTEIEVDGVKGLKFISKFKLPLRNGNSEPIRSWTLAFPFKDYFYQINFSDISSDDCSKVYDEIIQALKFSE